MQAQKRGLPTVTIVTEQFVSLARSLSRSMGYPDLPMVVVPHPFETLPHDRIRRIAEEKFDEIVSKVQKAQAIPAPTPRAAS